MGNGGNGKDAVPPFPRRSARSLPCVLRIDQMGLTIFDALRAEKGLNPIEKSGLAKHIATAAHKGRGTNDVARIEVMGA